MRFVYKFFFSLILFSNFYIISSADINISLELSNVDYIEEKKTRVPLAYVNETFQLKVVVSGAGKNASEVKINGIDNLNIEGTSRSTNISIVNGGFTSQTTYVYDVNSSKRGVFKIGPASVEQGEKVFKSNPETVKFKVEERNSRAVAKGKLSSDRDYELFCKQSFNVKEAVVGQAVVLKMEIYSRGQILRIGIDQPKFDGFLSKEIDQVLKQQKNIDGKIYSVIEKRFVLFPIDPGLKTVSAARINFEVPKKKPKVRGFGFFDDDFSDFFGRRSKVESVASNGLNLKVNPLPPFNGIVDGVGQFNKFNISFDKNEVIVNEPIVLTLEVEGAGNLDQIVAPKLNLPNFFSTYESKTDVSQDFSKGFFGGKKRFEYILQVGRPGEWELKSQDFVYFDTKEKIYKTLQSSPIKLNIKSPPEGANIQYKDIDQKSESIDSEVDIKKEEYKKDISFIEEDIRSLRKTKDKSIPSWLFLIFLFSPILFFTKGIRNLLCDLFKNKLLVGFFEKKELIKLKSDLNQIIKDNSLEKLHPFFFDYFSKRFVVDIGNVSEDWIERRLLDSGWKSERVEEFLSFIALCASFSFSAQKKTDIDTKKFLEKGRYWFFVLDSYKFK